MAPATAVGRGAAALVTPNDIDGGVGLIVHGSINELARELREITSGTDDSAVLEQRLAERVDTLVAAAQAVSSSWQPSGSAASRCLVTASQHQALMTSAARAQPWRRCGCPMGA